MGPGGLQQVRQRVCGAPRYYQSANLCDNRRNFRWFRCFDLTFADLGRAAIAGSARGSSSRTAKTLATSTRRAVGGHAE